MEVCGNLYRIHCMILSVNIATLSPHTTRGMLALRQTGSIPVERWENQIPLHQEQENKPRRVKFVECEEPMFPSIDLILRQHTFEVCTEIEKDGEYAALVHLSYSAKGRAKWAMKLAHKVDGYIRVYDKEANLVATLRSSSQDANKRIFSVVDSQGYHDNRQEYIFLKVVNGTFSFTHLPRNKGFGEKDL